MELLRIRETLKQFIEFPLVITFRTAFLRVPEGDEEKEHYGKDQSIECIPTHVGTIGPEE